MNNYENQIIDAIETIVEKQISIAPFDKTIKASVIRLEDVNTGKYLLKYQDSNIEAYASDLSISFSKGDIVYVLIPGNDTRKDKSILGKVGGNTTSDSVVTIENENAFDKNGINCINNNNQFELCSYKNEVKILYDIENNIDLLQLNQKDAKEYLSNSKYMEIGMNIRTSLPNEQRNKGNYGIVFEIVFKDENENNVIKSYLLDINNMILNPYRLEEKVYQSNHFQIDGDKYQYINKIYIFDKDFPNQSEEKENDIFISNIQLYGEEKISQQEYENNRLILTTPNGNYFTMEDKMDSKKTIVASLKKKSENINLSKTNVSYYWFKQNLSISNDSDKYNYYGGQGWECLNNYELNDDGIKIWKSSGNILTLTKEDVTFNQNDYKCVLILDDEKIEKIITIKNYDAEMNISIISDTGQQYYYDYGYPTLTCLVNNEDRDGEEYQYYWSVIDSNSQYTRLEDSIEDNLKYNNAVAAYTQLLKDIEDEKVFMNQVEEEIQSYLDIIEEYSIKQRVEKNKIHKINVNTISQFSTYKCTVYYKNKNIGTTSYTIYNQKSEVLNNYTLDILNGNKIFKYNENGISPASESLNNPIIIEPLSFKIYDNNGLELDELAKASCKIEWIVPADNSMIITNGPFDTFDLNYSIENIYDSSKFNNTIELRVRYKQFVMSAYTNLTFIKEGGNGTNGTEYVCRIVPNTKQNIDYPCIINGILNYTPQVEGKWFKVQMWKNGEKIFEDYLSGNTTEKRRTSISWSILKNKYTARYRDESNLLTSTDGTFEYQDLNKDDGQLDPANIVKCTIKYNNLEYYATLPIPVINIYNNNYKINWKQGSGYNYVEYAANGLNPKYNSLPFEITVLEKINNIYEDVSNLTASHAINYDWVIKGQYFDLETKTFIPKTLLEEDGSIATTRCQKMYRPINSFDGECVTAGVECFCSHNSEIIGSIHIPIHMILNRYEDAVINGWDGNSIELKEDQGYILTPQIGAGKKEEDNSFTGMIMGESKDGSSNISKTGLLGYNKGEQTLFLDSETGGAIFGKNNKGQILIDPMQDKSLLYSHDYWKEYDEKGFPKSVDSSNLNPENKGLLIDLSTPSIKYGDGTKFQVDQNGNVTCGTMITTEGVLTNFTTNMSGSLGRMVNFWLDDGSGVKKTITRIWPEGFSDSYEMTFPTKLSYSAFQTIIPCYIPKGFKISKAQVTVEHTCIDNYVSTAPEFAEGPASFPSYVRTESAEYGNLYRVYSSAIDRFGIFYGSAQNMYSAYQVQYEGAHWSREFAEKNLILMKESSGFSNVNNNNSLYGKVENKHIDFTDGAKANFKEGETNYIVIQTLNTPADIPVTLTSTTFVDEQKTTWKTYKLSTNYTNLEAIETAKRGNIEVQLDLYGYYDPTVI